MVVLAVMVIIMVVVVVIVCQLFIATQQTTPKTKRL